MDVNNDGQTPATDDQELARVLAGMNQQAPMADPAAAADPGLQYEEAAAPAPAEPIAEPAAEQSTPAETPAEEPSDELPPAPVEEPAVAPEEVVAPASDAPSASSVSPELESLKKDALGQLRPLIDHLNLSPQERFDTLLLIIRSTDDQSLLGAANEAAKTIEDDSKRAGALLDIIKEIDFFSHHPA